MSFIDAYEGSHIIDSSENKNGTLKIDSAYSSLEGSVDVGTLVINAGSGVPDSESHLYLRGENTYRDFNIESGQVHVESEQALCATGRTILEKDAKMIIANCTATAKFGAQGSTVVLEMSMKLGNRLAIWPAPESDSRHHRHGGFCGRRILAFSRGGYGKGRHS